jgi:hypothetical protein
MASRQLEAQILGGKAASSANALRPACIATCPKLLHSLQAGAKHCGQDNTFHLGIREKDRSARESHELARIKEESFAQTIRISAVVKPPLLCLHISVYSRDSRADCPLDSCRFVSTCPAVASREGGFVVNPKNCKKKGLTFSYAPD